MDLFRRKQKLIFWIVTIIIVPSFALVWGVQGDRSDGGYSGADFASVDGEKIGFADFDRFRRRFAAAMGETPFMVAGAPQNDNVPGLWDYLWIWSMIADAEKRGIDASDAEVGTFLRNGHPVIAQRLKEAPDSLDAAVNAVCMRNQISRGEFLRGVREWLILNSYVEVDNATLSVSDDSAHVRYALDRAEFDFKRIRVEPTDSIREQAKKDVMEKPAAELEEAVRAHISSSAEDARYRDPAKWRLAYAEVPFAADLGGWTPGDEDIQRRYDADKTSVYSDRPLDEVRDAVRESLAQQERERLARRNLEQEVDTQLRLHGGLDMAELAKLTPLVKNSVKAGDTGPDLRTAVDLAGGAGFGAMPLLAQTLDALDRIPASDVKTGEVDAWKAGFMFTPEPMRTANGYIRLKLVDYQPSEPAEAVDADGKIKPELFEQAVADLVARRVGELTRERADATEQDIAALLEARRSGGGEDGETAALFDELPVETRRYREVIDSGVYDFWRMGINEVRGPLQEQTPAGTPSDVWNILVLTERRVPNRASFDAEAASLRAEYAARDRNARMARLEWTFAGGGIVQALKPSETMTLAFWDKLGNQGITVDQELLRPRDAENAGEGAPPPQ